MISLRAIRLVSFCVLLGVAILWIGAGSPESAADGEADRCAAWSAFRTSHEQEADPHACVSKARDRLDLLLLPRASIDEPGADFEADVVVWLGVEARTVGIRIEGQGTLAGASDTFERNGRWQAGDALDFPVRAARTPGRGSLLVHAEVRDEDGRSIHAAAVELFILNEGEATWWSPLGYADLELTRAAELARRGELAGEALRAARSAAVGSVVEVDTRPVPERPRTHLELQIEDAYRNQQVEADDAPEKAYAVDPDEGDASPEVSEAVAAIIVRGRVRWQDAEGGLHGAAFATVEILEEDAVGAPEVITTTLTDSAGRYEASIAFDDGIAQGDPDLIVKVLAQGGAAVISATTDPADVYFVQSATFDETPDGTTLDVNFDLTDATNDSHTAFSVQTGLSWIAFYAGQLAGVMPSRLTVRFPSTGSNLSGGTLMNLLRLDRYDWDVFFHEYGHYVASIHGISNSPGGSHQLSDNLWARHSDKSKGLRIAWSEGWATFFGIAGQQGAGLPALAIPKVGDTRYTDTEDSSLDYDLETGNAAGPGLGEDNELSVITFLWDLFDVSVDGLDEVSFSDTFLFNAVASAGATTVGAAWDAVASSKSDADKAEIGGALGQAKVAPVLTAPPNQFARSTASPPTFKWMKNGAGTPNPLNDFRIAFFKNDFSSMIFQKSLGDVAQFTPTPTEWATILAGDSVIQWVVKGSNTVSPASPAGIRYWSAARTIGGVEIAFVLDDTESMMEEVEGMKAATQIHLQLIEAALPPGTEPPTIQVITFKDSVNSRVISNDLDVVSSVVDSLSASGGTDCPEYSNHALALAAETVAPGGTILFATDASAQPGVDVLSLFAKLAAKQITVHTIVSGECMDFGAASRASATRDPAQSDSVEQEKPGDDEEAPPRGPIDDPGQPVIDAHGNTLETATPLVVNGAPVLGAVADATLDPDRPDREDWFVVPLEAGVPYVILHPHVSGEEAQLLIRDATRQFGFGAIDPTRPDRTLFTPEETRDYHIQIFAIPGAAYRLSVTDDPVQGLILDGLALWSNLSDVTGGIFLFRPEINIFDDEPYVAAAANVMASTVVPTAISVNPRKVPRGTLVGMTLRGRSTNWRDTSSVEFSGAGLTVQSVNALSATTLSITVDVALSASLGLRDVTVSTPLGGGTETATGAGVVDVMFQPIRPTLVSVEPGSLGRDDVKTVILRGAETNWEDGATVSFVDPDFFGPDPNIALGDVDVLSPTLIEVEVSVAMGAPLGFRDVEVDSEGERSELSQAVLVLTGELPIPEIDAVLPNSGMQGEPLELSIDADNTAFVDGVTTADVGPGVQVLSVSVNSATSAVVEVEVDEDALVGFRNVVLTTGDESAVILDGFFVDGTNPEPEPDVRPLPANGKFAGCVGPFGEVFFSFEVPVDRAIAKASLEGIKVASQSVGKLKKAGFALLDPLGGEARLGEAKSKTKIVAKNVRLPLAGEHLLVVRDSRGKGGCFKGKAKIEPSQTSIPFRSCLESGENSELFFSALADTRIVKLSVDGTVKKKKPLEPAVSLVSPSMETDAIPSEPGGGKVVSKDFPLAEPGNWAVVVEGGAGCFKGKLKLDQGSGD